MTFDLTPEQITLVSQATAVTVLPEKAIDAVLIIEEWARLDYRRGENLLDGLDQAPLVLMSAAASLGFARAAIDHAIAFMKAQQIAPGFDTTVPHWALADAAAEAEGARLLVYSAAQSYDRGHQPHGEQMRVFGFAVKAARNAVDAALRIVGADGLAEDGLLTRLDRVTRKLQLSVGAD